MSDSLSLNSLKCSLKCENSPLDHIQERSYLLVNVCVVLLRGPAGAHTNRGSQTTAFT